MARERAHIAPDAAYTYADIPCPACGQVRSKVLDVRGNCTDGSVRRRRRCDCQHRYTTKEILMTDWDKLQNRLHELEALFTRLKALGIATDAA